MKVRMTQTVEVDGIPDTILTMLRDLSSKMEEATRLIYETATAAEVNHNSVLKQKLILEMSNKIRGQLSEAQDGIVDITSMLEGYVKIFDQPTPLQEAQNKLNNTLNALEQGPESGPDTDDYIHPNEAE